MTTLTFSLALNFRARSKLKITSIALKPPSVGRYAVLYSPRPPTNFDAQTLRTLPQTTYRRHNCRNDSTHSLVCTCSKRTSSLILQRLQILTAHRRIDCHASTQARTVVADRRPISSASCQPTRSTQLGSDIINHSDSVSKAMPGAVSPKLETQSEP